MHFQASRLKDLRKPDGKKGSINTRTRGSDKGGHIRTKSIDNSSEQRKENISVARPRYDPSSFAGNSLFLPISFYIHSLLPIA